MSIQWPPLRLGQPLSYRSLTVFPLFADGSAAVDYQLADDAIAGETVAVQEVSEGGSVPELLVENRGGTRVLFLEGEELRGAKQNRILNTSILVAAHSRTKVPVSCVEARRWRYTSKHFGSAKTRSPHKLYYALKSSVGKSLKESGGHRSDQGAVWDEVEKKQAALGISSPTSAMSDTYDRLADQMTDFRAQLPYPEGAIGLAIALGPKMACVDCFDQPATCRKAWDRLLSGSILDALDERAPAGSAAADTAEKLVAELRSAEWSPAPAVGEGQEFRTEFNGNLGSALLLDGTIVHANLLTAP